MPNEWNNRPGQSNQRSGPSNRSFREASGDFDRGQRDERDQFENRQMEADFNAQQAGGRGLSDPRDSRTGSGPDRAVDYDTDYASVNGNPRRRDSKSGGDISDFSLGIDRSNQNDRRNGEWFQSPYQSSSQFPSDYSLSGRQGERPLRRREGWGRDSAGFPQNPNYASYSPGENYSGIGPKGYRRSDDKIREDISHTLEQHPAIDASQLEVLVNEGIVTLKGHVEDRGQKRLAEDSIEHLPGVKDIRNELVIDRSLFARARDFFFGRGEESQDSPIDKKTAGAREAKSDRGGKSARDSRKSPM